MERSYMGRVRHEDQPQQLPQRDTLTAFGLHVPTTPASGRILTLPRTAAVPCRSVSACNQCNANPRRSARISLSPQRGEGLRVRGGYTQDARLPFEQATPSLSARGCPQPYRVARLNISCGLTQAVDNHACHAGATPFQLGGQCQIPGFKRPVPRRADDQLLLRRFPQ